tara:strand:- start:38 stop:631 length:594 start_codon:yes stop_codon:yes gene_type:complete
MKTIFSTPLWVTKLSDLDAMNDLVDSSYKTRNLEDSQGKQQVVRSNSGKSWHSELNFCGSFSSIGVAKEVTTCFNRCSKEYGYDIKEAKITYWTIITSKYGYNRRHNHAGSLLSAVLYLRVPKKSGRLIFTDPRPGKVYEPYIGIKSSTLDEMSMAIDPTDGLFVVFPSFLEHEVEMTYSDQDRIIASFNMTPLVGN